MPLQVKKLCGRSAGYAVAYAHQGCHRTSNMLDRVMRGMSRYFEDGQHLHGSPGACERHCRAWALLHNFRPWRPATARANGGWQSPAERLNRHRYHDNWLHNLLVSASLAGYRRSGPAPQSVTARKFEVALGIIPIPLPEASTLPAETESLSGRIPKGFMRFSGYYEGT